MKRATLSKEIHQSEIKSIDIEIDQTITKKIFDKDVKFKSKSDLPHFCDIRMSGLEKCEIGVIHRVLYKP